MRSFAGLRGVIVSSLVAVASLTPALDAWANEGSTFYLAECPSVTLTLEMDEGKPILRTPERMPCHYTGAKGTNASLPGTRYVEVSTDSLTNAEVSLLCSATNDLQVQTHIVVTRPSGTVSDEAHDDGSFRFAGAGIAFSFESHDDGVVAAAGEFHAASLGCGVGSSWSGSLHLVDPKLPELSST